MRARGPGVPKAPKSAGRLRADVHPRAGAGSAQRAANPESPRAADG
jgi:hypothetical protein